MSRLVEELVKSGQRHNLMSTHLPVWESTITAGIQMDGILEESGASPLTQIRNGSFALFHIVMQHTTVKRAFRWVSLIQES